MTELSKLPPGERVKRYRELAKEAGRAAGQALEDEREAFLYVASAWKRLADITEQIFAARLSDASDSGTDEKLAAFKPTPAEPDEF